MVRIGAGEIAAASCLPAFVREVEQHLPGVSLEISLDLTANLLQQLLSSISDIVFLAGPVASPGLRTASIGSIGLRWLASQETAARFHAGACDWQPRIWSLPHHSPLHQVVLDAIAQQQVPYRSINTCNNVQTLIDIVTHGQGMSVFPESMVRTEILDGTLVDVLPMQSRIIPFEAAIRSQESDPVVLDLFARARRLSISHPISARDYHQPESKSKSEV